MPDSAGLGPFAPDNTTSIQSRLGLHPRIVTTRDNGNYSRAPMYSQYTSIRGPDPTYSAQCSPT